MNVQILSDLHLDFHRDKGRGFVEAMDPTGVDVLVLAGDLAEARDRDVYTARLRGICAKYPHVVMVNGNHDLYGGYPEAVDALRVKLNVEIPNLHWLENESWRWINPNGNGEEGNTFHGSCLWFRENPLAFGVERMLADFKVIKNFKPWVYERNAESMKFLKTACKAGDIVVTHHLPSQRSVDAKYKGSLLNAFFVCEMDDMFYNYSFKADGPVPQLWIHGHTHTACDYKADATRVVCNPLGYPGEGGTNFNDKLVLTVS